MGHCGELRAWQAAALNLYLEKSPKDFLAVATPGAGKTTFALRIAVELMGSGVVDKVTVRVPHRAPEKPVGRRRRTLSGGSTLTLLSVTPRAWQAPIMTVWPSPTPRWHPTPRSTRRAPALTAPSLSLTRFTTRATPSLLGGWHLRGLQRCHPPPEPDGHPLPL